MLFLDYDVEIRVICSTNAIESLNVFMFNGFKAG